ncbi:molybdopterin-dependent oxidoreductase [Vibrio gallicus]|uniref:molybdopterin-dependent oxidoreductase n=1 Tax=Vibrio gallicus TaxID=190897 RepID=UPI0021C2C43F|nr:molybdopterin-dependent oxidoreductase [Vibrio gallicus]
MDRRKFLKGAAGVGIVTGGAAYSGIFARAVTMSKNGIPVNYKTYGNSDNVEWRLNNLGQHEIAPDYCVKHTTCLQCHSECGLRVKVNNKSDKIERIIGNPYHPNTLIEYTNIETPISATAAAVGTVCARGNAGIETVYDEYRIHQPLKRAGKRGEGKWKTISWEQLIAETVHGGKIFDDTTDEQNHGLDVRGFKALYAGRDTLIDPKNPEYGFKSNQFVLQAGRIVKSRKDFQTRFCNSFGTVNNFEHTNICELSHHIATAEVYAGKSNAKADITESEFMVFFGTAPGEANFPMQTMGKYSAEARVKGAQITVVDPVLPRTVQTSPNTHWICPNVGSDGAIAAAILRSLLETQSHNQSYLSHPTFDAAKRNGELSYSNASYLIEVESGKFAKHGDKFLVADQHGNIVPFDTVDSANIEFKGELHGKQMVTSFSMLRDSVFSQTMAQYSEMSGVPVEKLEWLAKGIAKAGRKSAVEFYRGIAQHPNGYYTGFLINQINVMMGNMNWTGGLSVGGGGYDYNSGAYNLTDIPGLASKPQGLHISREKMAYEDSSEFKRKVAAGQNPYPAPRPWFPITKDVFSEIIPSLIEGYPYKADILMWHMCTPLYSTPATGRDEIIAKISDPKQVPLLLASDIVVGDSSAYADYIIPDLTYLEQFVHHPMMEATMVKGTAVRTPVIEPTTAKTAKGFHMSYEQFLIDVAIELQMPGFGEKAIPDSFGKLWPLNTMSDYYIKGIANLAHNFGSVPEVTDEELRITGLDTFYSKHKDTLKANEWLDVLFAISRGGLFDSADTRRKGDQLTHQFNGCISLYSEKVAQTFDSMTGKRFKGQAHNAPSVTALDKPISELDKGFDMTILTRKSALQSHSRLSGASSIRQITPTNYAEINKRTGEAKGLKSGDMIWIESVNGKRKAEVKLREGIAENAISFIVGFGHNGYGASDYLVDNKLVKGSKQRKAGFNLNPIMRTDPDVENMGLMDKVGGSTVFYDTKARIVKA